MVTRRPAFFFLLALLLSGPAAHAGEGNVDALCDYLGKRLHSVSASACDTQHFLAAPELTPQGTVLAYRDYEPALPSDDTKRIMVVGGIHGDELTAVSIVFNWIDWLQEPDAAQHHWRMIPLANPDGLMARPPTRFNANGVDLNRNFQTPDWDKNAQRYWVERTRKDARRYPGETAGSEVETRWLQAQIEEFHPDLVISIHAPYNLLDYDGEVPEPTRFGRLVLNRLGVYPGSMGNYCGLHKRIPIITIELPNATSMPGRRELRLMWQDMLKWINTTSMLRNTH